MGHLLVLNADRATSPHYEMAIEALRKEALLLGHDISLATLNSDEVSWTPLASGKVIDGYIVLKKSGILTKFKAHREHLVLTPSQAILKPKDAVLKFFPKPELQSSPKPKILSAEESLSPIASPPNLIASKRLVGITACPTGIAHTFMAAEALRKEAQKLGYALSIETQGSVGAKSILTAAEIAEADAVIIAADTAVDLSRFAGKVLYRTDTSTALKKPNSVIEAALDSKEIYKAEAVGSVSVTEKGSGKKSGPYQHLLTGVSYMLPLVVAGGLLIALSFVFGIDAFKTPGTLPAALMQIGGGAAFKLIVPILAGFIAYSIADRPGLTPGLVGGWLAAEMGSGFLGGIIAGFVAGYVARFIRDKTPLPVSMQGLMPILIIPLFATLITGLLMIYVIGAPMKSIMDALTNALLGLSGTNAILLGAILGAMMAFDLGGPTNKAAYAFTAGLLSSNTFGPMAATMAGGMVPPLAVALACVLARSKFSPEERQAGKTAGILGLCFISEAAIPFAARDPFRVIPCNVLGAAITGGLSMYFGCGIRVPHGGVFIFGIPNAVENLPMYCVSILVGTVVTAIGIAVLLRQPKTEGDV